MSPFTLLLFMHKQLVMYLALLEENRIFVTPTCIDSTGGRVGEGPLMGGWVRQAAGRGRVLVWGPWWGTRRY